MALISIYLDKGLGDKMLSENIKAKIQEVLYADSCYPEKERKNEQKREQELLEWYEKYGEVNEVYNLYGMDCVDSLDNDEWLDRGLFRKQRHDVNAAFFPNGSKFPMDYTLIMRDKRMFESFAAMILKPDQYIPSIGTIIANSFYLSGNGYREGNFENFIGEGGNRQLVFKEVFGCSGEQVRIIEVVDGQILYKGQCYTPRVFFNTIAKVGSCWIIQEVFQQHSGMAQLNASSVNTIRIITYNTGERIVASNAVVRYGRPGSRVDNGCFFVGIDSSGTVGEYAFDYVNKKRLKCSSYKHVIPFFEEAFALSKKMHSYLPECFTIGWDVAIGANGPVFIEGNDGWDPFLTQTPLGNQQRKIWNKLLLERKQVYKINL